VVERVRSKNRSQVISIGGCSWVPPYIALGWGFLVELTNTKTTTCDGLSAPTEVVRLDCRSPSVAPVRRLGSMARHNSRSRAVVTTSSVSRPILSSLPGNTAATAVARSPNYGAGHGGETAILKTNIHLAHSAGADRRGVCGGGRMAMGPEYTRLDPALSAIPGNGEGVCSLPHRRSGAS
jgi:hypothetical protein